VSVFLGIVLVLLGLIGTALFAGLETGIIAINRLRLRHMVHRKIPGAAELQWFLDHPDQFLGTTLVGTNLSMVLASVVSASLAYRYFGTWGSALSGVVMTLVILVGCEYLPKAWFQGFPAARTRPFARFLRMAGHVLNPISRVVIGLTDLVLPVPAAAQHPKQPWITKEELKHLAHEGEKTGALTAGERRMIHGVFELTQRKCSDVATPIDRVVSIRADAPVAELLELARVKKLSRFPVRELAADRYVGIVHIFDVLHDPESGGKKAADYMRSTQFVAGATPVDDLLPRLRANRQPIVLVTGSDGKVTGLITLEDVLEEIVGEL
jgi:putative hemolysin